MPTLNINDILGKLNEVRAIFVLGQRTVPFLEEMFAFLKEISPLLDDINSSIRESTHKMPDATSKLHSVTQATELATTEILDLVDHALEHIQGLKKQATVYTTHLDTLGQVDTRLMELLREHLGDRDDDLLQQVEALQEEKHTLRNEVRDTIKGDVEALAAIRDKLNCIMMALQVQDITAQQLSAANHLIESIRDRLTELVARLGSDELPGPMDEMPPITFAAFDPDAEYDRSGTRQHTADEVIAAYKKDEALPEDTQPSSQANIDKLFSGDGAATDAAPEAEEANSSAPASQADIDKLFTGASTNAAAEASAPDEPTSPTSQGEIDKLFGSSDNAFASQDDIDKLFGN